jgi:hypothetical protein
VVAVIAEPGRELDLALWTRFAVLRLLESPSIVELATEALLIRLFSRFTPLLGFTACNH